MGKKGLAGGKVKSIDHVRPVIVRWRPRPRFRLRRSAAKLLRRSDRARARPSERPAKTRRRVETHRSADKLARRRSQGDQAAGHEAVPRLLRTRDRPATQGDDLSIGRLSPPTDRNARGASLLQRTRRAAGRDRAPSERASRSRRDARTRADVPYEVKVVRDKGIGRRFTLELERPVAAANAAQRIFKEGKLPAGWQLDAVAREPLQWLVTMPEDSMAIPVEQMRPDVLDEIKAGLKAGGYALIGGLPVLHGDFTTREELAQRRKAELNTTLPGVGLTVRDALALGSGLHERDGYFIHVGSLDETNLTHGVEVMRFYKNESFNESIRWLVQSGASLAEAERLAVSQDREVGRVVVATLALSLGGDDGSSTDAVVQHLMNTPTERRIAQLATRRAAMDLDADAEALHAHLKQAIGVQQAGTFLGAAVLGSGVVGGFGEKVARDLLARRSYDRVLALQNPSGQGLDLVGVKGRGDAALVVYFEVKTSTTGVPTGLKPAQRNIKTYAITRLTDVARASGRFAKVDRETKAAAQWLLDEIKAGRPIGGAIIDITHAGKWEHFGVAVRRWLPRTRVRGRRGPKFR